MSAERPVGYIAGTLAARSTLPEQQLRERDEIFTMAEHAAGIGVWDIDLGTQTVRGTPQFWRIMGLPPTDHRRCRSKRPGVCACLRIASASRKVLAMYSAI